MSNVAFEIRKTKKLGFGLTRTTKRPVRIWAKGHRLIDTHLISTSTTFNEWLEPLYQDMIPHVLSPSLEQMLEQKAL